MVRPPRVMPALVTPFSRNGELDLGAHRHNLEFLFAKGLRGFVLGGSTGEGPYLEPGERERLAAAAREVLGRRAFLLSGVAAETTREAMRMVAEAAGGGADAALVLTPTSLTRGRLPAIEGYYLSVAAESPIPVYLYSVPSVTAFELPEPAVARLSTHPNIVGMKDSGGQAVRMQRLAAATAEGFMLYAGSTAASTLSITAGAYGVITASANYVPELVQAVVAQARRSPAGARRLQQRLSAMSAAVEGFGIPGVKAAAAAAGLKPGYPRLPLRPLSGRDAGALARRVMSI